MELVLFHTLVIAHIITGVTGAIAFWVPVIGRKGGVNHRRWGQVFTLALLCTGIFALGMSILSLLDPLGTHPHLAGRFEESFLRGMFGHLMLHTAILTINLAWYGWLVVRHRSRQALNRTPANLALQWLVIAAAINCAVQGWLIGQPLMMAISVVGVATAGPTCTSWPSRSRPRGLAEGACEGLGRRWISVYTAFLAFGSVRVFPELALHPGMWSVPLIIGLAIIIWHRQAIDRAARQRRAGLAQAA
jgi:hypothetical protein